MDRQHTVCFTGHRQIGRDAAAIEARVTEVAESLILSTPMIKCKKTPRKKCRIVAERREKR